MKLQTFLFQMVVTSCIYVQYLWKYGFAKSSDILYAPCISIIHHEYSELHSSKQSYSSLQVFNALLLCSLDPSFIWKHWPSTAALHSGRPVSHLRDCRLLLQIAENWTLLGCYTMSSDTFLPTFRDNLSVPTTYCIITQKSSVFGILLKKSSLKPQVLQR